MKLQRKTALRRGTYAVEFALISPFFFFFVFAHIIGSLAVFQYIQVASLAREGARWASTHGYDYRKEKDEAAGSAFDTTPIISATNVYTNAIAPKAVGINLTASNVSLAWSSTQPADDKDQPKFCNPGSSTFQQNYVTVQVTYTWVPIVSIWGVGSKTLTSSSTMAVSY